MLALYVEKTGVIINPEAACVVMTKHKTMQNIIPDMNNVCGNLTLSLSPYMKPQHTGDI